MPGRLMTPLFSHPEDLKALQVSIPRHPALDAVLAGDVTIPCLITYLGPQPTAGTAGRRAVLGTPRVKWTFISEGREVEILVARGDRVKVSEDYRLRASLPIFHQRYTNASLLLTELRPNDSGIYRCDVQHGIEDGHDILDVKVKGTSRWGAGWDSGWEAEVHPAWVPSPGSVNFSCIPVQMHP